MALAPVAYLLYDVMRHNPADPAWPDRDRFILSAGHASMLQYAALHLSGYDLPLDELRRFRQWGSATPNRRSSGTRREWRRRRGRSARGFANGVGLALANLPRRALEPAAPRGRRPARLRALRQRPDGRRRAGGRLDRRPPRPRRARLRLRRQPDTIDGATTLTCDTEDKGARLRPTAGMSARARLRGPRRPARGARRGGRRSRGRA